MADATLGNAVLQVTLDQSGLVTGLRAMERGANTALTNLEQKAEGTGRRIGRHLGEGFSALSQINLSSLLGAGGAIYALVNLEREAFQVQTGMRLLERQMERNNISFSEGRGYIEELGAELKVMPESLADNVAQLLRTGLTMEEISAAFRGGAASALAFGKDVGTGIETVSSAIITGRSQLLDTIGISQNLDNAYKEYAATLGTTADKLTTLERAQAAVRLITSYTKEEVEDIDVLLSGFGGAVNDVTREFQELKVAFGEELMPVMTNSISTLATILDIVGNLPEPVRKFGAGAAAAAVGVTTLATAITALKVAFIGLGGPAGLILGVTAVVGGLVAVLSMKGAGGTDLETAIRDVSVAASETDALEGFDDTMERLADNLSGRVKRAFEGARDDIWAVVGAAEDARVKLAEIDLGAALLSQYQDSHIRNLAESVIDIYANAEGTQQVYERLEESLRLGDFAGASTAVNELIAAFGEREELIKFRDDINGAAAAVATLIAQRDALGPPGDRDGPPGGGGGDTGDGGGAGAKERTWEDVFKDVAAGGVAADRMALAFVGTSEEAERRIESLQTKVRLAQDAIRELIADFDFTPAGDDIQYLVGKMDEWNAELATLGQASVGSLAYLNDMLTAARQAIFDAPTPEAARVAAEYVARLEEEIRRRTPVTIMSGATARVLAPEEEVEDNSAALEQEARRAANALERVVAAQREVQEGRIEARERAARLEQAYTNIVVEAHNEYTDSLKEALALAEAEEEARVARLDRREDLYLQRVAEAHNEYTDSLREAIRLEEERTARAAANREENEIAGLVAAHNEYTDSLREAARLEEEREARRAANELETVVFWHNQYTDSLKEAAALEKEAEERRAKHAEGRIVAAQLQYQQSRLDGIKATEKAQEDLNDAMNEASALLDTAPSRLEQTIATFESLTENSQLSAEQLEEVRRVLAALYELQGAEDLEDSLDDVLDKVNTIAGALVSLVEMDWGNGNAVIEGLTSTAGDLLSLIPGIGPAVGKLISTIGGALSAVLGDLSNGLAEVKEETEDLQADFKLIDIESLVKTTTKSRGGLLGLLGFDKTVIDQEATDLGLSIAESLESGVLNGLRRGLDAFLETGKVEDLEFALQEGIYSGVTDALLAAIVEQGVIQSILGPKLLELTEAIAAGYESGSYTRAMGIMAEIQAMVPEIARELTPLFGMLRDFQPTDPNAPPDDGTATTGGRQISEFTGPSRDLLTDLLAPLASLVSVPELLRTQLQTQESILAEVTFLARGTEAGLGNDNPPRWLGNFSAQSLGAAGVTAGETIVIENLSMTTDAKSARELYRDISTRHAIVARGRRR